MSASVSRTNLPWESDAVASQQPQRGLRMTEEQYVTWAMQQDVKTEWVDGDVIMMAPANFEHADLNGWLLSLLRVYVEKRDLGIAVFDVFVRLTTPQDQLRVP